MKEYTLNINLNIRIQSDENVEDSTKMPSWLYNYLNEKEISEWTCCKGYSGTRF